MVRMYRFIRPSPTEGRRGCSQEVLTLHQRTEHGGSLGKSGTGDSQTSLSINSGYPCTPRVVGKVCELTCGEVAAQGQCTVGPVHPGSLTSPPKSSPLLTNGHYTWWFIKSTQGPWEVAIVPRLWTGSQRLWEVEGSAQGHAVTPLWSNCPQSLLQCHTTPSPHV